MSKNKWDALSMRLYEDIVKDNEYIPIHDEEIDTAEVSEVAEIFRSIVFTGYFGRDSLLHHLSRFATILEEQTTIAFMEGGTNTSENASKHGIDIVTSILNCIPETKRILSTDVKAVFDGDPAAKDYREVILCYPSILAISYYRLAHALWEKGVPVIPRMITEISHSRTGIDIHPGAKIGEYFSIDHGTGVVIGETCIIGNHVRLYQGVTLGAKSFKFDNEGNPLNEPRHPIIEDNVTIYSNTSVLGRITIGHDSVIGGNIWQTTSLPPYSRLVQGKATISAE